MNAKRQSTDDLEDAAFRARLAPLAAAVLPRASTRHDAAGLPPNVALLDVAAFRTNIRPRSRKPMLAVLLLAGVATLSSGTWLYLQRADLVAMLTGDMAPPPPAPPLPENLLPVLLQRGDAALATGDVTAARLLYQRAADAGLAEAALALGRTYDLRFFPDTGLRGNTTDQDLAAKWYRRAAELGDPRGNEMLMRQAGKTPP